MRIFSFLCGVVVPLALAALSVYAAFLGAEAARELFNSGPMRVFWAVSATALAAGLLMRRAMLRRRPAVAAMHLGALLIIAGGILGSEYVHNKLAVGSGKPYAAYVALFPGIPQSTLFAPDMRTPAGALPFSLRLNSFDVERYEPADKRWRLWLELPGAGGESAKPLIQQLDWQEGKTLFLSEIEAELTVLQYLEHARPVFDRKPELIIITRSGQRQVLAAEPGRSVSIPEQEVAVRIKKVFENLRVVRAGAEFEAVEAGGGPLNPALLIELELPGGAIQERYIMAASERNERIAGLELRYEMPQPAAAESDVENSDAAPAMLLRLVCGGSSGEAWLVPQPGRTRAGLAVDLPAPSGVNAGLTRVHFYLIQPEAPPRAYKSDVSVLEHGKETARKTVMVNSPLYYKGYHVYQHSYDSEQLAYTVLFVKSSRGLAVAYAGFALLCLGALGWGMSAFRRHSSARG